MTTSGQICKMSNTAYCLTYCNMGQPYCNILQYAFCRIVSPLVENIVRKGEIACYKQFLLFNSPEHNMLRMSYCDQSLSGVRVSIHP